MVAPARENGPSARGGRILHAHQGEAAGGGGGGPASAVAGLEGPRQVLDGEGATPHGEEPPHHAPHHLPEEAVRLYLVDERALSPHAVATGDEARVGARHRALGRL